MIQIVIDLDLKSTPAQVEDYVVEWAETYLVPIFRAKCAERRDIVMEQAREQAQAILDERTRKVAEARRRIEAAKAELIALQAEIEEDGDPLAECIDGVVIFEAGTDDQHEDNQPFNLDPDPAPQPQPRANKPRGKVRFNDLLMGRFRRSGREDAISWAVFGSDFCYDAAAQTDPDRPWAWRVCRPTEGGDDENWTGGFALTEVDAIRLGKSAAKRLRTRAPEIVKAVFPTVEAAQAEMHRIALDRYPVDEPAPEPPPAPKPRFAAKPKRKSPWLARHLKAMLEADREAKVWIDSGVWKLDARHHDITPDGLKTWDRLIKVMALAINGDPSSPESRAARDKARDMVCRVRPCDRPEIMTKWLLTSNSWSMSMGS